MGQGDELNVIVVGAGLAGLAAADRLRRAGAEVQVFEARDRVGGRVWSVPFGDATIERGAEFILPDNSEVRLTAERLGLTDREVEVLGHVAGGLTADAVARLLRVSPRTVRKHLENAYRKLDCHDRLVAVQRAQALGIIPGRRRG